MMALELNKDKLKTLTALGGSFFTVKQCSIILEVDLAEFIKEMKRPGSPIFKAYYSGYFTEQLKLRQSIADLAMRGSGPAQQQLLKIIDSTEIANR